MDRSRCNREILAILVCAALAWLVVIGLVMVSVSCQRRVDMPISGVAAPMSCGCGPIHYTSDGFPLHDHPPYDSLGMAQQENRGVYSASNGYDSNQGELEYHLSESRQ